MENKAKKNILLILGQTDTETFSGALADHYQSGAESAGYEVERINIGELAFDPVLYKGYKEIQELEPDLVRVQESILRADHIVIVYPNWWCTMPAILKGLFDRIWLPGFAFKFNQETNRIEKLLKGKTARVIVVAGSHSPFKTWWLFGDYTNEIQYGILGFAGVSASVSAFGPCEHASSERRSKWLQVVESLGRRGI